VGHGTIPLSKAPRSRLRDPLWAAVRSLGCAVAHPVETWRRVDGEGPAQVLHVHFPAGDRLVAIYWRRLRHPLGYRGHIANPEFLAPASRSRSDGEIEARRGHDAKTYT
jgi:hypothetical protein